MHLGKSRKSGSSEVEILRGENRRLRKALKHYERREHWLENVINVIAEDLPIENKITCSECGKGELQETDLGRYINERCNVCSYKKLVKK